MKIGSFFRSRQYLYQVYVAIALAAIIVITSMLWLVYYALKDTMLQLDHKMSGEMLTQMQNNIEAMGRNNDSICMSAFYNYDVQHLMHTQEPYDYDMVQSLNRFTDRFIGANPSIHSAYIYNSIQDRYLSTNNGINNLDEDFIVRIARGDSFSTNQPVVRYVNDEVLLTFCVKDSYREENRDISALYVNIRADWLLSYMDTVHRLGEVEEGSLLVFDSAGSYIDFFPNTPEAILQVGEALVSHEQIETQGVTILTLEIDSQRYTGTLLHEPRYQWKLVRIYPYEQLFSGLRQTRMVILLANIITAVLISVVFFLLAKGIYRPVDRLLKQVGHQEDDGQPEFEFLEQHYQVSKNELQKLQTEADTHNLVMREHMLRKLVFESNTFTPAQIKKLQEQYSIALDFDHKISMVVLSIDDFSQSNESYNLETDKPLLLFGIINIISEIVSRRYSNECIHMEGSTIVILYQSQKQNRSSKIKPLLQNAGQAVKRIFDLTFSAAIGDDSMPADKITSSYTLLTDQLNNRFMLGNGCIIDRQSLQQVTGKLFVEYRFAQEEPFLEQLSALEIEAAKKELTELLSAIRRLEFQSAVMATVHLSKSIQDTVFELNRERNEPILIRSYLDVWGQVPAISLFTFEASVNDFLAAIPTTDTSSKPKQQIIAEMVLECIESSYADDNLRASSLADTLGISASHVGRVFKSHYDMTIPEYINHVRLHKAIAWMQSSDLTIQEVMQRVGYQNEAYFYKVFKENFETTPRAYIQALHQDTLEEL